METEFIWVINPAGRRVEVDSKMLPDLISKGFRELGGEETSSEDLDKEFLEVVEL